VAFAPEWGKYPHDEDLVQITPGVHQLWGLGCHVFALIGDRVTLIDAGAPGNGRLVLRQLRSLGVHPGDVEHIIITHYHPDHRGAVNELQRATGARVLVHVSEAPYFQGQHPFPNPVNADVAPRLAALTRPLFAATRGRPLSVETVEDGDTLDVLGGLRVLHTPGHTQGSVVLWLPGERMLFAGDAMGFRRGRLELPDVRVSEDAALARSSLERLAGLAVDSICFSHFRPLPTGARTALEALVGGWSEEFRASGDANPSRRG
jgi:glyoxylase-like metal-dependent hydrolase (beta-lactamase superfamily II)